MTIARTTTGSRRLWLTTGAGLAAFALLTACTTEDGPTEDTANETTAEAPADQNTPNGGASDDIAVTDDAATEGDTATETTSDAEGASGDDPVFSAIEAVLADYADGIIVDIDRDDDGSHYDVDVVAGDEIIELEVTTDGDITEDEREGDDDDIQEAQQATVTASEAIEEALSQNDEAVLDEAQLDEDDDQLTWEIDLDDQDGNDMAELNVPAN